MANVVLNNKQEEAIKFLENTYGSFDKEIKFGFLHLKCKRKNYPITFYISEDGLIGDEEMISATFNR